MKKNIFFILIVMIITCRMLSADDSDYHDIQQIGSYEYYIYVTGGYNKPPADGGGGGGGDDKPDDDGDDDDHGGGPVGRYDEIQRQYSELQNRLSSLLAHNGSREEVEKVEAELRETYASLQTAIRQIAETQRKNQSSNSDALAENNSAKPGDPVKATVGVYVQEETDISTKLLAVKRKYESDDVIVSSLGRAWTSSLDQRIIYGIEPLAEMKYENLLQEAQRLKNREDEYTSKILSDYNVTSLESGADEINERIEKFNSIQNEINELQNTGGSYVNTDPLRNEAAAKKEALENDLRIFNELLHGLENLREEYNRLSQEAEDYKNTVIKKNQERKLLNKKAMFQGSPAYYEETGLDSLTYIDDDGYPHILYEVEEGVWKNEADKSIAECKVCDGGLLLIERNGNTKQFDESGLLIRITDRNGNYAEIIRTSEGIIKALESSFGEKYSFEYTGGFIHKITNERASDENVCYSYIGNRLSSVKDFDGDTVTMDYDSEGRMISLNKCDGSSVKFTYGEQTLDGRILATATTNEEGYEEHFEYDRSGMRTDYIDHDGKRTVYWYDEKHKTVREIGPDGTDIKNEYDADGNLVAINENGSITRFSYDVFGNKTEASYSDGSNECWTYDSFNQVTSYKNRDDVYEEFIRDDKGNLCEYKKGGKTAFRLEYDSKGQIVRKTVYSQNPVVTEYEYDSYGNLIKETCIDSTEYEYDNRNRITKIRQAGKLISEYIYEGHKTVQKNYNGLDTTYITNGRKDLTEVHQKDTVTGVIHKTRIEYDRRHLPLKVYAGDGTSEKPVISYTYTPEGELKSETLHGEESWTREPKPENAPITQKKYTKQGLLSAEQTEYGGWYEYGYQDGNVVSMGEQNGTAVKIEYYPDDSIKSLTDRYGKITYYSYDRKGRVSSVQGEVRKVWYEYDSFDRITKQIVGNSPDESSSLYYSDYEYSSDGRKVTVTEGGKYKTLYELDAFGNVTKQIDGNNNERSFVYNTQNHMTESYDGYGNKTAYEYNALGKLSRVILPDGAVSKYSYNNLELLEKITDEYGVVYEATYDNDGRIIKEKNRADSEKSYEYDNDGRVIKVLCGEETVESYSYGAYGRNVTVKDGNGNDYFYHYDGFGRLLSERNRNGIEQNYYYDAGGQLKSKRDFSGATAAVTYSSDRTVRTVRYSDGSENCFMYDALGNITTVQNEYGKTLYRYDQGGRLVYQKDVTTGEEVYFEYDAAGNRTKLYSTNRETSYSYGKNNEVKEIFDNKQRVSIKLEYDKNGRELLRKFGNGTAEHTLYDKTGRVIVKMQKGERGELLWGEGYSYGSGGKRNATVDNSGRVTLYEYDKQGRLSSVYYPCTDEMKASLKKEAEENGLPCLNDAGENKYLPSEIRNKLIPLLNSMQYGLAYSLPNLHVFIKESYAYDKNSNRITKTTPYGTIEYSYDKENCLKSSGSRGQVYVNYTYDKAGNLLTEESSGKTVKYAYNSQNRLIYCEVTDRANKEYAQTTYAYDAFGRRVIVQDKGESALRTLYDGLTFDVIKQSPTLANGMFTDSYETGIRWGNTGRPTGDRYRYLGDDEAKDNNRYFYLDENTYKTANTRYRGERTSINVNGTLAAQTTADYGAEYFTTDLLGSVRTTSDTYGTAKSTYTYDAFGTLVQGSLNDTTDYGYLGKQQDATSHLYNYGYRDYKPTVARFTTSDPIRDGQNWFTYCNSDPVNFVDLLGLELTFTVDKNSQMMTVEISTDYYHNRIDIPVTTHVVSDFNNAIPDKTSNSDSSRTQKTGSKETNPTQFPNGVVSITSCTAVPNTYNGLFGDGWLTTNATQSLPATDGSGNVDDAGYYIHYTGFTNTNGCIGVKQLSDMERILQFYELNQILGDGKASITVKGGKKNK